MEMLGRVSLFFRAHAFTTVLKERSNMQWTRSYTIWLLMLLSLLPGGVIALEREIWTALPAGVRAAVYLTSAALIAAACALIIQGTGRDHDS
jgi:uncharacterized membrane protein YhiD involved in acid resistance